VSSDLDPFDLESGTREHYQDAALYDFEYRRRRADVNHYRRLARELGAGRALLELGCGTGRLSIPLARDGHTVVGLDLSLAMLRRARERSLRLGQRARRRVHLVCADMRRFALDCQFHLIVCPFNAFQHLYTRAEVAACLATVRRHLAPSGYFAFDVLNPDLKWLTRDPNKRWAKTRFLHPTTRVRYEYSTNQTYDPVEQIAYMRIYYEKASPDGAAKETRVVRLCHRQFFPAELESLLAHNGFRLCQRWGGFAEERFDGAAESQVLLCQPAS
jgi:SAM-dependent methyltransferase